MTITLSRQQKSAVDRPETSRNVAARAVNATKVLALATLDLMGGGR